MTVAAHRARSVSPREFEALIHICDRLRERFPDVHADEIGRIVHLIHTSFEESRIRDFIPILVERLARDKLEHDQG